MEKTRKIKILSVATNIFFYASFAFLFFTGAWFVIYTPDGDMAEGLKWIAYTIILFSIACGFLVISTIFRFFLLRNATKYRTRAQYTIFGVTAILSILIVFITVASNLSNIF